MKKLFWISMVIAILAVFFASANPDGLDFVAEKLGFAERGQERTALLPYSAGVAGVLITLSLFWLSAYLLRGRNNMRKMIVLVLLLLSATQVQAATPYIYANTSWGALGGGLGFDLGDGKAIDLCATGGSGPSGSTHQLYADYFIGCWGAGVTAKKVAVNADLAFDLNLQYALEQAINEKVTAGASFTLINYDTTTGADPNWTFIPSIGAYIKLPL